MVRCAVSRPGLAAGAGCKIRDCHCVCCAGTAAWVSATGWAHCDRAVFPVLRIGQTESDWNFWSVLMITTKFRIVSDQRDGLLVQIGRVIAASDFTIVRPRVERTESGAIL